MDHKLFIQGVNGHLGLIWYHSEPSKTSFLAGNFFAASYSKTALGEHILLMTFYI